MECSLDREVRDVRTIGTAALLLLVAGASACGRGFPTQDVLAVREAALREQVAYWLGDHARESGVVICLAVQDGKGWRGLDGSFLDVSRDRLAVRPAEQCDAAPGGAVERATSKAALILRAGTVTWVSKAEAVVEVEYFRNAGASGRRRCRVVREEDGWVCLGQVIDIAPA